MNGAVASVWLLRARLQLARLGPAACVCLALCLLAAAGWAWLLPQRAAQARWLAEPLPVPAVLASAPPPPSANENLDSFYAVLGEQRYAEQQLKILFGIAAKNGLALNQGEYKLVYDKASGVASYQLLLPLKGSYQAAWQFSLQAPRALPFAALEEVSLHRETIADTSVEARLRLTLYLKGAPVAQQP